MFSQRLFNFVVATALLVVIGLTVREAAATTVVTAQQSSTESLCDGLPTDTSIHTEYVEEKGAWMTYTEEGPTGVNGGLIQLLSDQSACQNKGEMK